MKFLVTGGCGFLGSNLSAKIIEKKEELFIIDNLFRKGSDKNLQWLKSNGDFKFFNIDIRNFNDIEKVIKDVKPDVIIHLAGQVAMTTSIENPRLDFETNTIGTVNVLESVRKHCPSAIVTYSSSNKVYGDFEYVEFEEKETRYIAKDYPNGFNEEIKLDFHSPYGCSKGAADQYLLDYARIYDLKTIVFRHSSMYGGHQYATEDQGWIGWFCQKAIETHMGTLKEAFTISGNGKQVRDVLYVDDVIDCYFKAIENIENTKGQAFNIGGGIENSLSLLELFDVLENILNIKMKFKKIDWRESDQKVFVADNSKINRLTGWSPETSSRKGIEEMINWIRREMN